MLPFTVTPRGVWVSASRIIDNPSAGQVSRRIARCGSREASQAHGSPISTQTSWRVTTAYESS